MGRGYLPQDQVAYDLEHFQRGSIHFSGQRLYLIIQPDMPEQHFILIHKQPANCRAKLKELGLDTKTTNWKERGNLKIVHK